ncbi:MAG: hypothetical protein ABFR82_14325 [Nitrospirota bacterium]
MCSRNRECIFTEIQNTVGAPLAGAQSLAGAGLIENRLNWIGQIINNNWRNIPNEYGNVDIDEFIIMPNHLHGIIIYKRAPANKRAPARGAPTDHGGGGITATLGQIIGVI